MGLQHHMKFNKNFHMNIFWRKICTFLILIDRKQSQCLFVCVYKVNAWRWNTIFLYGQFISISVSNSNNKSCCIITNIVVLIRRFSQLMIMRNIWKCVQKSERNTLKDWKGYRQIFVTISFHQTWHFCTLPIPSANGLQRLSIRWWLVRISRKHGMTHGNGSCFGTIALEQ